MRRLSDSFFAIMAACFVLVGTVIYCFCFAVQIFIGISDANRPGSDCQAEWSRYEYVQPSYRIGCWLGGRPKKKADTLSEGGGGGGDGTPDYRYSVDGKGTLESIIVANELRLQAEFDKLRKKEQEERSRQGAESHRHSILQRADGKTNTL